MATYTWGTSGAPADPPWTAVRSGLSQTANTIVSTSAFGIVQYNAATFTTAHYCEAVWKISASLIFNGGQYQFLRANGIDNYFQIFYDDGRHDVTISSRIAGSQTLLYTVAVPTSFLANDVIRSEITSAGLITLKRNGSSYGSYDAAAVNGSLTGTAVGIGMSGSTTDQGAWGDWGGGILGAAHVRGGAQFVNFGQFTAFGATSQGPY